MPKVGMPCAGGEDEIVIIQYSVIRFYFFRIDIHGFRLGENDFDVFAFTQNCAHRGGNVGGRERRCRDLIK